MYLLGYSVHILVTVEFLTKVHFVDSTILSFVERLSFFKG